MNGSVNSNIPMESTNIPSTRYISKMVERIQKGVIPV